MGQLTRAQIVTNGLATAGRTNLTTLANGWLNSWLKKQYDAWPWPFLVRRVTGLSLVTGSQSLTVGAGTLVTPRIRRILDPIWFYNSARTIKGLARIRQLTGGSSLEDETLADSATWRGLPTHFKVRADTSSWGKWILIPGPFPDRDLTLAFDYIESPTDMSTGSGDDAVVPLYPCDETMELCVEAHALRYGKQPEADARMAELAARASNDRVAYGTVDGINDSLGLDPSTFL